MVETRHVSTANAYKSNTRMIEGISCPSFEFPARVAGEIYTVCKRLDIQRPALILGLEDLASAFRRVPTSQPEYTIVILYDPSTDSIVFHQVYGMCLVIQRTPAIQSSTRIPMHTLSSSASSSGRSLLR